MTFPRSRHLAWWVAGLGLGCGFESHEVPVGGESEDALARRRGGAAISIARSCSVSDGALPQTLECTGLYADVASKKLSNGAVPYAPAFALWSDGATKQRWIFVPEGKTIDNSQPNDWQFPVGTRVWKEFSVVGKRVETRIFQKVRSDRWLYGTYVWDAEEASAAFSFGGDIEVDGEVYHVPTQDECADCHDGAVDSLLGFEAVSLGLPGAEVLTLERLAKYGWLSVQPERVQLSVGDDGTGLAAQVLPLLHINCGTSCHNKSANATANLTSQNLRLDATQLDGREPDDSWSILRTTLGQEAEGAQWGGATRIAPGDPDGSLAFQLMSVRTGGNGQMPPIASRIVDHDAVELIRAWILLLPPEAFE
jgi:hypothetical protein